MHDAVVRNVASSILNLEARKSLFDKENKIVDPYQDNLTAQQASKREHEAVQEPQDEIEKGKLSIFEFSHTKMNGMEDFFSSGK